MRTDKQKKEIKMANVKIINHGGVNGTEIFLNGKKITGITKFTLSQKAGSLPMIQIDLISDNIDIECPIVPELPEMYKHF